MSDDEEQVGSVGEEAAKLLSALQDWARENGGEYADAAAGAAKGASSFFEDVNEHVATGGAECRYCPLCQVISAVRQTSPEVRHHLASAAGSLAQALAGLLATDVPGGRRHPSSPPVEKIDLSDDGDWEDDG